MLAGVIFYKLSVFYELTSNWPVGEGGMPFAIGVLMALPNLETRSESGELMNKQWFALFIRTRWESSTELVLRNKGFETFLPTCNAKSLRNGRVKDSFRVLFPGYVFCRFDIHNRLPILVTPGVISVVGRGRTPVALEDSEITAIQTIASSGLPVEPWPYLEIGERVRIQNHALAGLEGILLRFRGSDRVVVSVPLLRRSVAVEIDRSEVSATRSERFVSSGLFPSPALAGADTV
jgi:transcription antitermination factor NusG